MNSIINFIQYIVEQRNQILTLLMQHIYLSFIAVSIAVLIGVPLGILVSRIKKLQKPVLGFANVMQAIPSLALLGFLIPLSGIGSRPAIIMVVLYSLLPIIKNTHTGLSGISPEMLEAAAGIGLTKNQILTKVQLPLALPVIMAGIRISAVTAVGLMTISAFVGAGGLGYLVFSGVQTVDNQMILAGAIPACVLALLIDFLVGKLEYKLSYTSNASSNKKRSRRDVEKRQKFILLLVALTGSIVIILTSVYAKSEKKEIISIGSKNFTEQLIVGNMLADMIEEHTDLIVERKLNLGGTQVAFSALKSGDIDGYVEYTGTGLVNILKQEVSGTPDDVYRIVKEEFEERYQLSWMEPLGFNNTYALAIKQETATEYDLKTISDLVQVSNDLIFGPTIEFPNRPDGLLGLQEVYGLTFQDVKAIDGSLRYTALMSNESDVIDAFSTDGLLKKYELVVLEDDKNFFPPYYAVPLFRMDTLEKYPELIEIMNQLADILDDDAMRELNYKVDDLKQTPESVARDFLLQNNLIQE